MSVKDIIKEWKSAKSLMVYDGHRKTTADLFLNCIERIVDSESIDKKVYSDSKYDEFKNRSIPTITSIIKNSRAVRIKIEIENDDGTVTTAELL